MILCIILAYFVVSFFLFTVAQILSGIFIWLRPRFVVSFVSLRFGSLSLRETMVVAFVNILQKKIIQSIS